MAPRFQSVRHLLQDKPTLQHLERELGAQRTLLADVRQCLPADLADHCAGAHIREQTLVIHVDSPAWATRLRYLAPQLAKALAGEYKTIEAVKIRLIIDPPTHKAPAAGANHSDRAAEIIHTSASCAKPGPVQAALHRLADALKTR